MSNSKQWDRMMRLGKLAIVLSILVAFDTFGATVQQDEDKIRQADAAFWKAYNACDMRAVTDLFTADVEFYHDKTGLTTSREAVVDSLRNGPCADENLRLRREALSDSIEFHPLKGGYALLSGRHRFYVQERQKAERLDGQADFTTVWKVADGRWRMHRVLSYAHGPVPYTPPSRTTTLPPELLERYAGLYRSPRIGIIQVAVAGDHLTLTAGSFVATLYPQSTTRFFAMERDLRFDFEGGDKELPRSLAVYENGVVSERAVREDAPARE
ncbi:DUF4440 domain-containing protein [Xanthomonas hortorum]|uniref:nuclear transport factor 2 family protein n=1 Tax=Xanthomonas hortorum TaxID=56454 RepID=UPI0029360776|nr:DUF4440 domain-containing protein [Xanthomonas hortorum]MDV2450789.1 DUF4440 domain-containing protein [Xanthomonas hortorum NBC5720]